MPAPARPRLTAPCGCTLEPSGGSGYWSLAAECPEALRLNVEYRQAIRVAKGSPEQRAAWAAYSEHCINAYRWAKEQRP